MLEKIKQFGSYLFSSKKNRISRKKDGRVFFEKDEKDILSSSVLAKIKRLQLKAKYLVTDTLLGEYSSSFKGRGMEFEKLREYIYGDDIRQIDWNVTAKTGKPFVKIYKEERETTLMLMVDLSMSEMFGTSQKRKNEVILEFIAILTFIASQTNDKVGLILFSDKVHKYIPPKKGRSHMWNIIRTIMSYKPDSTVYKKYEPIEESILFLIKVMKKKANVFLISDFLDFSPYKTSLSRISKKHDFTCVRVWDEWEENLENVGVMNFLDLESNKSILVDTNTIKESYSKDVGKYFKELENFFRKERIGYISLRTDQEDIVKVIETYIRTRSRLALRR